MKVWLLGVSPMIWRRVLVPASFTLRELHGVLQVAMGWEGVHLYLKRLAIIRARARKQRGFLLGLTDNGAELALRLAASVLAIIVACSPTELPAHNRRQ